MSPYVITVILGLALLFLLLSLATILIDASGGDAPDLFPDPEEDIAPIHLT